MLQLWVVGQRVVALRVVGLGVVALWVVVRARVTGGPLGLGGPTYTLVALHALHKEVRATHW